MKKIKLVGLEIRNFKGIKHFALEVNGGNVAVFGENATGKTTIFDSFTWLLFDKDSNNRTDFQLKSVDGAGKELHGLEHEVKAVLDVDGRHLELKKVLTEKWSKKRGSALKTFGGHTTDYFIDGVPSKKKEYTDQVAELMDEEIFKLLTSPTYFNEQLHWSKRREVLLEIAGDATDEEVIESNPSLRPLLQIISNRSIEDHKKVIAAKRVELNKELEKLPVRIDEVQRSMDDLEGLDKTELTEQSKRVEDQISELESLVNRILNGHEAAEKRKQISEIEVELNSLKQKYQAANFNEINLAKNDKYTQESVVRKVENDIRQTESDINLKQSVLRSNEAQREELRVQFREIDAEAFDEHQQTCPTCKQDLPEVAVEKAMEEFNSHKSQKLANIRSKGHQLKGLAETVHSEVTQLTAALDISKAELEIEQQKLAKLNDRVAQLEQTPVEPFHETSIAKELQAKISELQTAITNEQNNANESALVVKGEIQALKNVLSGVKGDLQKFDQVKKAEQRIFDLEAEERKLAQELEALEKELFMIEEFIQSKVSLLEDKINSKFDLAHFKLFEEQINGGIKETCETLYKGVPYSKGLNNAAKINVGLDIINTLSKHYEVEAPIFIDNSESVTKLLQIDSQMISLVVSAADKKLRVELKEETANV